MIEIGNIRPKCIWHQGDIAEFYKSKPAVQEAWNDYVERAADDFNSDPSLDSYDSTNTHIGRNRDGKITNWCPPLFFPEWRAAHLAGKSISHANAEASAVEQLRLLRLSPLSSPALQREVASFLRKVAEERPGFWSRLLSRWKHPSEALQAEALSLLLKIDALDQSERT